MCGILFELFSQEKSAFVDSKLMNEIRKRGPDCSHNIQIDVGNGMKAGFYGAVLWMQGLEVTPQPVENDQGILLYNGDIFDQSWNKEISDTQQIMQKLSKAEDILQIVSELKILKGPFSIIYYDKTTGNLFFTRDRIGRNSLLFHKSNGSMIISSVLGRNYKCFEIPASHIQIYNLKTKEFILYPWNDKIVSQKVLSIDQWHTNLEKQQSLPDEAFEVDLDAQINLNDKNNIITYIEHVAESTKCRIEIMRTLLKHEIINQTVLQVTELLEQSVKIRLERQPHMCKECLKTKVACEHCTVGILFSGGLDCTILALLADKYIPKEQSVDLLNVAFSKKGNESYEVPDRITGKQSFEELNKLCPTRKWLFKEINITREELEENQKSIIADLVYPRQTILDESLGSALWFAAKGQDGDSTSSCRVLLVGSGADELFGGYTRHKNAFKRQGWTGLYKELQLDWNRISFRNLARDNRVICDHGRQPRMPYLDEDFSNYVLNLKPWLKCFPNETLGKDIGMKLMLRLVAFNLGLTEVMAFPKRALQFGSRIAISKENGADISKRFIEVQIND